MTNKSFINHRVLWLLIPLLTLFNLSGWGTTGTLTLSSDNKFGTSSGSTKNDDQGNTWTCTCSNIQNSYQTTYSGQQFGTGKSPADATFTCTIAGATISSVKATMATGEGGTYTIKVGGDTKYSGSLTTTATEYGGTSATGTGEIEIKITKGTKASYLGQIIVVYSTTPASKYTVSFSTGTGNPSVDAREETSAGSGITLPSVTPACSSDGWALYGWATSACSSETSTAPAIVGKPGDSYKPAANNTTLYAVYAKGEYTKVTSTGNITSGGKYLVAGYDGEASWLMGNTYTYDDYYEAYYMSGTSISTPAPTTISASSIYPSWRYVITGSEGHYVIKDVADAKYVDVDYEDWYRTTSYSVDDYTITFSDGYCSIRNNYASKYLTVFDDGTFGRDTKAWAYMLIYKETTTPSYYSNPTCASCDANPSVGAASLNGTFLWTAHFIARKPFCRAA